jgi:polysaccharide biosynthesis protein PslH
VRRNILVVVPGGLFPTVMASQVRVIDMIRALSAEHRVDVAVLVSRPGEAEETRARLGDVCGNVFALEKPNRRAVPRFLLAGIRQLLDFLLILPAECLIPDFPSIRRRLRGILRRNAYDVVQIEFWMQAGLLDRAGRALRVVDTHDVLHEKRRSLYANGGAGRPSPRRRLWLKMYERREMAALGRADCLISLSPGDLADFRSRFPQKEHLLIPTGQDIGRFVGAPAREPDSILFYGAMHSRQNIDGFWRLWNSIYPMILRSVDLPLIVLGAGPPDDIRGLAREGRVTVTGFVEDVREFIARSLVLILPLSLSGGFRSRVVEAMAMGVPVVGTRNALDSVGLTHGVHGYISDDDAEIAGCAVRLATDRDLRKRMSARCVRLASEAFSIGNTYGRLSRRYAEKGGRP